jgi:gamma-glutamylcyclotransferase (GGCT)/AIG2-like uncharacterized protein YtfP
MMGCAGKLVAVACYGTLKSDGVLAHKEHIICSKMDKIKAKMYEVNGASFPFPAIKLEGEGLIEVEVQIITEWYKTYMDMVEGYLYSTKEVITESGVPCLVYEYNYGVHAMQQIKKWEN